MEEYKVHVISSRGENIGFITTEIIPVINQNIYVSGVSYVIYKVNEQGSNKYIVYVN